MIRFASFAFVPFLFACTGDDDSTAPPPPARSVIETCVAGGGHLSEIWHESNAHGAVTSIAVSGTTIVLGSVDGSVKQWNLVPGGAATATYGTVFAEEGPPVAALAVSGDDRLLGADQAGHLAEWKLSTAEPTRTVTVTDAPLSVVAVGVDHAAVAQGPASPDLRVIDRASATISPPLTTLLWGVTSIAFGHGGALFTAGHFYGTPMIERRPVDAPVTALATSRWGEPARSGHVNAIAVDAAATTLVAAGDEFVAVFPADDLTPGPTVLTPAPGHTAVGVVLFSGNELFATAGSEGTLQLWSVTTGEHLATLSIPAPIGLGIDSDGSHVFTSGPDGLLHAFACR